MIYYDLACEPHGGECCGVQHLYNFPDEETLADAFERKSTFKDKVETISYYMSQSQETKEVVLTLPQATVWERALQTCGFKRVLEFVNPNTNRILRMYLSTQHVVKRPKKVKTQKEGE